MTRCAAVGTAAGPATHALVTSGLVRPWLIFAALSSFSACDSGAEEVEEGPRAAEFRSARIEEALDGASEVVQTRGFSPLDGVSRGFLVENGTDVREESMRSGTCYVVLAAASAEMRELDVRIYDSGGVEVVGDASEGAQAALRFCPSQSGTYFVAVRAAAGAGLFGVRTFRGPTGLEIRTDDLFREVAPEPGREGR